MFGNNIFLIDMILFQYAKFIKKDIGREQATLRYTTFTNNLTIFSIIMMHLNWKDLEFLKISLNMCNYNPVF